MAQIDITENRPLQEVKIEEKTINFEYINQEVEDQDPHKTEKETGVPVDIDDVKLFQQIVLKFINIDLRNKINELNQTYNKRDKMRFIGAVRPDPDYNFDKMGWFILSN